MQILLLQVTIALIMEISIFWASWKQYCSFLSFRDFLPDVLPASLSRTKSLSKWKNFSLCTWVLNNSSTLEFYIKYKPYVSTLVFNFFTLKSYIRVLLLFNLVVLAGYLLWKICWSIFWSIDKVKKLAFTLISIAFYINFFQSSSS